MKITLLFVGVALLLLGLYKLFEKAGRKGWEALIPGYNFYVWLQIIEKPWWWLLLLLFPGVNIVMLMVMCVILTSHFGYFRFTDVSLSAFAPYFYLPYLGFKKEVTYLGPIDRKKHPAAWHVGWRDAIVFAIVAASLIRTYFLEAFTIPTSSMEKSLLVGDYLFVSKFSYGPKVPQTPIAFPFTHHTLPILDVKSYLDWWWLPYFRLPGLGEVERNDVVVFNFPAGDTVIVQEQGQAYEQIIREFAFQLKQQDELSKKELKSDQFYRQSARKQIWRNYDITVRPVDKREHYVKRCVAVAGDELKIENGILYINGEMADLPEKFQYNYFVKTKEYLNQGRLKDEYGISYADQKRIKGIKGYEMPLTFENYKELKEIPQVEEIMPAIKLDQLGNLRHWSIPFFIDTEPYFYSNYRGERNRVFPNDDRYNWSEDNFGSLTVPKAGETVSLSVENLPLYERIITVYEGNSLKVEDDIIFINGQETSNYTFQMNYYFMMGDNRHNSLDSRFWGFVPEDHVVGKALFIWLSLDQELSLFSGKIRWERLFNLIE